MEYREPECRGEPLSSDTTEGLRDFLLNVAHQLINPLQSVEQHLENLREMHVDDERRDQILRSCAAQCRVAQVLVENLGHMESVMAGAVLSHHPTADRLSKVRLPVGEVVMEAVQNFAPLAHYKDVGIDAHKESLYGLQATDVYRDLFRMAIANVIDNAVKYASEQSTVFVSGKRTGTEVLVIVRSRGISLRPSEAERVFDRGYRGEAARSMKKIGTGIGLWIVDRICHLHGGKAVAVPTDAKGWTEVRMHIERVK